MARTPPLRVAVIGPESTGKTTLATRLAGAYAAPRSVEFARVFVDEHPRPVTAGDVDAIARGQITLEDAAIEDARRTGAPLVVHDTDLVSTVVYSRHYFGACPPWIDMQARARLADLYLLHDIDVPWEAEGFQRAEPERREELLARFRATLDAYGARVTLVSGDWDARFAVARTHVDDLLAGR